MELLVAVGLMVILITAVVIVFVKSTQVFRKAESLMEIFQNARAAIGTIGREVAGSFPVDSNNQEFILHNPRSGSAIQWTVTDAGSPGVDWTDPFLVTITQTAWVDSSDRSRVVGAAKVLYRMRRDPTGLYRMRNTTVTLERVLLRAERIDVIDGSVTLPIDSLAELRKIDPTAAAQQIAARTGGGTLSLQEDLCKFVRYQPTNGDRVSFHIEYFYVDPNNANDDERFFLEPGASNPGNWPLATPIFNGGAEGLIHFSPTQPAGRENAQNLPIAIRIKMQVVDDKENEIRTVARVIWIPAARSE